ncbi:MAG: mycofactocin-coupled SDR family oxidoreductase [Aeromicrobium sp.]
MGKLDGKVAFITGAARGQGRSHAVMLAAEGADIIAVDICAEASPVDYPAATPADLEETVRLVEGLGRRIVARQADVRSSAALAAVVADGVAELGSVDVVVANAGIVSWSRFWEMPDGMWQDMIDINLTGVFNTLKAAVPSMIEQGRGGAIVITSSVAGIKSLPAQAHYSASKHGVVGLMKTAAIELAPFDIRVNAVHPWGVDTAMGGMSGTVERLLAENPSYANSFGQLLNDPPIAQPQDISEAVLYLVGPSGRLVTGISLPVDAGATKV